VYFSHSSVHTVPSGLDWRDVVGDAPLSAAELLSRSVDGDGFVGRVDAPDAKALSRHQVFGDLHSEDVHVGGLEGAARHGHDAVLKRGDNCKYKMTFRLSG
jgi:hypothetical protein